MSRDKRLFHCKIANPRLIFIVWRESQLALLTTYFPLRSVFLAESFITVKIPDNAQQETLEIKDPEGELGSLPTPCAHVLQFLTERLIALV